MKTYQDLLVVPENDSARAEFVRQVITDHMDSDLYKTAKTADAYYRCRNTTTMEYQKTVTDVYGRVYTDALSKVHRSTSNFYFILVTQLTQYLLGNGVSWEGDAGKKLGADFDNRLQELVKNAMNGSVAFGFWNLDHMEVFPLFDGNNGSVFAPLYDEETGALAAGVRSWQLAETKPLRATLYELDGYTEFMWLAGATVQPSDSWTVVDENLYMKPKAAYKTVSRVSQAEGVEILDGENYPSFPIIPLWNPMRQSALVGLQEKIDAYDFTLNGWEDDLDNAQLLWIIHGAGGMDDPDLMRFLDRLRTTRAAAPEDGQTVTPVTVDIPVAAREAMLVRLERQLYKDAMIMNPEDIAGGAATATQIRAAYERQNVRADLLEYSVLDFLQNLLTVAGIEDKPTFTRSMVINVAESIQTVIQAAPFVGQTYTAKKVLTLLGDGDNADEILQQLDAENMERLAQMAAAMGG